MRLQACVGSPLLGEPTSSSFTKKWQSHRPQPSFQKIAWFTFFLVRYAVMRNKVPPGMGPSENRPSFKTGWAAPLTRSSKPILIARWTESTSAAWNSERLGNSSSRPIGVFQRISGPFSQVTNRRYNRIRISHFCSCTAYVRQYQLFFHHWDLPPPASCIPPVLSSSFGVCVTAQFSGTAFFVSFTSALTLACITRLRLRKAPKSIILPLTSSKLAKPQINVSFLTCPHKRLTTFLSVFTPMPPKSFSYHYVSLRFPLPIVGIGFMNTISSNNPFDACNWLVKPSFFLPSLKLNLLSMPFLLKLLFCLGHLQLLCNIPKSSKYENEAFFLILTHLPTLSGCTH